MAGHSKWKQIKHKKALLDSRRGKSFTKLIKEITVAARLGGGDPESNPRLRTLVEKAKFINMPQENTQRAIKKGTGELPGTSYEPHLYEGYGPEGIAVIIETLTDNKNRTVADLRHAFSIKGGNLGETGSVNWMFEKMGVIKAKSHDMNEDQVLECLIDFDIVDFSLEDDVFYVTSNPKSLEVVKEKLKENNLIIESCEIEWVAKNNIKLEDENAQKAYEFLDYIEDLEDVQNVYTNLI